MKISLVCVGKIKEKYLTEGIAEFTKRLTPYCKLETIAIGEEKMPDSPSPAEKEQVLAKETERLINAIPASAYVVLLDLQGREITSPQLAELFDGWALAGQKPYRLCYRRRVWLHGRFAQARGYALELFKTDFYAPDDTPFAGRTNLPRF